MEDQTVKFVRTLILLGCLVGAMTKIPLWRKLVCEVGETKLDVQVK